VLDRLSVDTGLVTVIADLKSLEMRPSPSCPRSWPCICRQTIPPAPCGAGGPVSRWES